MDQTLDRRRLAHLKQMFKDAATNLNPLVNALQGTACSRVLRVAGYSWITIISVTVQNRTHVHMNFFLLRITHTIISQSVADSSWITLYVCNDVWGFLTDQYYRGHRAWLSLRHYGKTNLPISPAFTAIISKHGKTKSYLHRFGIIDSQKCPCKGGDQTPEHFVHHCKILKTQRDEMKRNIKMSGGKCPTSNEDLIAKYLRAFTTFINSIDFDKLS
jgi:hypothetical protein